MKTNAPRDTAPTVASSGESPCDPATYRLGRSQICQHKAHGINVGTATRRCGQQNARNVATSHALKQEVQREENLRQSNDGGFQASVCHNQRSKRGTYIGVGRKHPIGEQRCHEATPSRDNGKQTHDTGRTRAIRAAMAQSALLHKGVHDTNTHANTYLVGAGGGVAVFFTSGFFAATALSRRGAACQGYEVDWRAWRYSPAIGIRLGIVASTSCLARGLSHDYGTDEEGWTTKCGACGLRAKRRTWGDKSNFTLHCTAARPRVPLCARRGHAFRGGSRVPINHCSVRDAVPTSAGRVWTPLSVQRRWLVAFP